jgi:UDP-galactopyranose mutase
MRERQDVVLGAGLTGLTAALTFAEHGESDWQIYERGDRVGGHACSNVVDGYTFDYGPHILFTNDPEVGSLIRDLLGDNFTAQTRQAFIYHHAYGMYTRFPFQAHLHGLPTDVVAECLVELVGAVDRRARGQFAPTNYEEWMRGTFGHGIAERLMIPYARKLWTVEPSTMAFNWIERRVPTPDIRRIIAGALHHDVEQVGATAEFWYPREGGIEALPRALGERVGSANLHLGTEVERLEPRQRRLTLAGGHTIRYDRAVYTLPLNHLTRLVPKLPPRVANACAALQFQGILCVDLGVDRAALSPYHWVYFYEDGFPFHRLSYPANFSPANVPRGKSSISLEVAFRAGARIEANSLVAETIDALVRAGALTPEDRVELVHTKAIEPAYVIYDLDHARNVEIIRAWLAEHDITIAGRFGEWQYANMDHAMRSGIDAARLLVAERAA